MRLKKLYHLRKFLPAKTKYYLCNSLILFLFDYWAVVSSVTQKNAHLIQKIQNSCMRFSFNIPFRSHITPYLNNNKILNMEGKRKCHMFTFIYKIVKYQKPAYLHNYFNVFIHPHNTRNVNRYRVPQHRTTNF